MKERLVQLFTERFGRRPEAILEMGADGSSRHYFRLVGGDGSTVVGTIGPDHEENRAFLSFAAAFRDLGLPVPEILSRDEEAGVWLQEDLGRTTLFDALTDARNETDETDFSEEVEELYRRALSVLPRFQVEGHRVVDYGLAYPRRAFDKQSIRWDLNYFKYHFLKLTHTEFSEQRLEKDFKRLTKELLRADGEFFLYRDFQSRNIMIREGEPWFIDFQGGRRGALQYDPASLLFDAKANLPRAARERLLSHYLSALDRLAPVDEDRFRHYFKGFVMVRLMQAMGAFGYRGIFEGKRHFLESVPFAARNLQGLLDEGLPVPLPEIEAVFGRIVDRWASPREDQTSGEGLTVLIRSFSFRKGYPEDDRGHGGGFVFDCRALPNPGRLPEYQHLTGRDEPVAVFLENAPEVEAYWRHVRGMVEAHLEDYLARGFRSLTVSFGCTGGQHRSVFMAGKLEAHLRSAFPEVKVERRDREL